jgi:ATP-binding cassette subfamily C protein CydC
MPVCLRLLRLIAPFRWWIAFTVVLSFATLGSGVGLMAMSAYLISKAALATSVADLSLSIAAVQLFAISRVALRYVERYVIHATTFRILTRLRVWVFAALEPLAPARLLERRAGDVLTRLLADIDILEHFYARVVVPPLAAALVTALASLLLGAFDAWLGLALLIFLVLTGVALPLAVQWLSRAPATHLVATRAELAATLVDEIQGMADLLVCGQEASHQARALALGQRLSHLQERMAVIRGLGLALGALLASLAGITVLWLAIPLVSGGKLSGVFLALLPLTAIASFEAVQPLSLALQNLEASQAAARRVFELIDAEPAVPEAPPAAARVAPEDSSLEMRHLRFAYAANEPPVLDDVSFTVPAGGCVAIVGPSGAGKSTLASLLLCFWEYSAGSIRLGGHDLREYTPDAVRAMLSVVAQESYLFNGTIRNNLLLADPDATDAEIIAACRQAQLDVFIQGLPHGYDTWVGENGLRLSGGERQRLAIARAILKDAPILILDEATTHLDAVTEKAVWAALQRFMRGRTTLIIAHHLRGLEALDQVFTLDHGRLRAYPAAVAPAQPAPATAPATEGNVA